ncbi:MAG: hypothetical protein QOE97_2603 [Pseudonocardiales bacterium]|nr:hypothetical protein [Pseudonocardiales bacterium]
MPRAAFGQVTRMLRALLRGATAGAAATTALNAVTYLDMVMRGRPASEMPEQAVEKLAADTGVDMPGEGEFREHRVEGLGPLLGIATGVGLGVAAATVRPLLVRLPPLIGAAVVGGGAMAASDLPMTRLGLTDPKQWSPADWASDVLPHLAYGLVTVGVLRQLGDRRSGGE